MLIGGWHSCLLYPTLIHHQKLTTYLGTQISFISPIFIILVPLKKQPHSPTYFTNAKQLKNNFIIIISFSIIVL